jgi:hypothetical protein
MRGLAPRQVAAAVLRIRDGLDSLVAEVVGAGGRGAGAGGPSVADSAEAAEFVGCASRIS